MSEKLDELKQEADDLGIKYMPNIGEEKLQAKIDAYYESQESSGKEIAEAVKANEKSEENTAVADKKVKQKEMSAGEAMRRAKERANKTSVITIIDNDQRVNNQTTTCKVGCSNVNFDLGQMVIPLNVPVEVKQGHIDTLKSVKIPMHVKDPRTGLNRVTMRNRYTIQYEHDLTAKNDASL